MDRNDIALLVRAIEQLATDMAGEYGHGDVKNPLPSVEWNFEFEPEMLNAYLRAKEWVKKNAPVELSGA